MSLLVSVQMAPAFEKFTLQRRFPPKYTDICFAFCSPIPVSAAGDAEADKLVRASPRSLPPGEEEATFGGAAAPTPVTEATDPELQFVAQDMGGNTNGTKPGSFFLHKILPAKRTCRHKVHSLSTTGQSRKYVFGFFLQTLFVFLQTLNPVSPEVRNL